MLFRCFSVFPFGWLLICNLPLPWFLSQVKFSAKVLLYPSLWTSTIQFCHDWLRKESKPLRRSNSCEAPHGAWLESWHVNQLQNMCLVISLPCKGDNGFFLAHNRCWLLMQVSFWEWHVLVVKNHAFCFLLLIMDGRCFALSAWWLLASVCW